MGIQVNGSLVHWNYFIALEQDLAKVSRFIEFSEANFNAYSIELAHLLLAASSEVDVVLKALCNLKNPAIDHQNINQYRETIKAGLPDLIVERCFINRYGLDLEPWSNWQGEQNPIWWRSYNRVKHQRDEHFSEANLKNTINAVSGLSLVVLYYYRELFSQNCPVSFKDVTRKLKPEPTLIEFNSGYVYHNLIVS
ncbi:hypothetical protein [uncultured Gilvimarinus sp.]|uniref:hypothetical protein n=1 Tax=uncultured Gilvimarinus sp. TaxID=1689143 RepID=UPI0030EF2087|tara:strand:+ start:679 stop:1263 length:585 start_codon:yes stop_codon:yes gene_type:complete